MSESTLDTIWNNDNFQFKVAKFIIVKLTGVPCMDIKNVKKLLKQKLNVEAREVNGFMYLKESGFWLMFVNNDVIISKKLLLCSKIESLTVEELVALKEEILEFKEHFKYNEQAIYNRPCAGAMNIMFKALEKRHARRTA